MSINTPQDNLIDEIEISNDPCNILIIGKSGVGKSTLINTLFSEIKAKTDNLKPCTQSINYYSKGNLNIYDSPGLELPSDKLIDRIFNDKNNKIKQQVFETIKKQQKKSPQEHISIIYYCIKEKSRFETQEENWINELSKYQIPIILVITQSISSDNQYFNELEKLNLPVKCIIPVLAQPVDTRSGKIEAHGLENLIEKTLKLLPEGAKIAFSKSLNNLKNKRIAARAICATWVCHTLGSGSVLLPTINKYINLPLAQTSMLVKISLIFGLNIDIFNSYKLSKTIQILSISMGAEMGAEMVAESIVEKLAKELGMENLTINISSLSNAFIEVADKMGATILVENIGTIFDQAFPSFIEQMSEGIPLIRGVSSALSTLLLGLAYTDVIYEVCQKNLNSNTKPSLTMCEDLLKEKYKEYLSLFQEALRNLNNLGGLGNRNLKFT